MIKNFRELRKNDANIAGGKGASLGEMLNNGIPVPDGFVLLATVFEELLDTNDLGQKIETILREVQREDMTTIENASENIRSLIVHVAIPAEREREILHAFRNLRCEFVAVRSSATAEDGADHAWAGQLDSFLNTAEETLLSNIKKCFASLFSPRAIFYRLERNLQTTKVSVAVVVQKMIQSEVSGIAFSVHPVTEDHHHILIEAGFGLGEAIVSGQITPDSYIVDKEENTLLEKNITEQERWIFKEHDRNIWKTVQK